MLGTPTTMAPPLEVGLSPSLNKKLRPRLLSSMEPQASNWFQHEWSAQGHIPRTKTPVLCCRPSSLGSEAGRWGPPPPGVHVHVALPPSEGGPGLLGLWRGRPEGSTARHQISRFPVSLPQVHLGKLFRLCQRAKVLWPLWPLWF